MGIREEIEKLRQRHLRAMKRIDQICQRCELHDDGGCLLRKAKGTDYYIYHFVTERALAKVLSILDEHLGECVGEGPLTNLLATRISDLIERNVRKGDTIAIYRRRER